MNFQTSSVGTQYANLSDPRIILLLACTFSGDGATHKAIPYVSKWAVMIPHQGLKPKDCFLGITPELDHTVVTQVESFKRKLQQICDNYNVGPFGSEHYFD